MKAQQTCTDIEYGKRKRIGRREAFLDTMAHLVPWEKSERQIRLYYFHGKHGLPPKGIKPCRGCICCRYGSILADEALEELLYDSCYAMRRFMRLDFGEALDAAAPLNFRYLLDEQGLQKKIFEGVNKLPEEKGKIMRGRTIIEALASAKNGAKSRDSDMYRSKKGKERHFRMRAHIEVDAGSGMVLGVSGTAVNVNSIEDAGKLIREDGEFVNADAGYRGIEKREEIKNDEHVSNKGGVANKQT